MDIYQITQKILFGRDLSREAHEKLIKDELTFLARNIQKEIIIINKSLTALSSCLVFPDEYLSMRQIGKLFNVSKSTIANWRKRGIFLDPSPVLAKNGLKTLERWSRNEVEEWRLQNGKIFAELENHPKRKHKKKTQEKSHEEIKKSVEDEFEENAMAALLQLREEEEGE